jgi:hypothetical protein
MFISRPNRGLQPISPYTKSGGYRSGRHKAFSRNADARAFVAALLLWGVLLYVSRPALSHSDQLRDCVEGSGFTAPCVVLAHQQPK